MPPITPEIIETTGFVSEFTFEVNEGRDSSGRIPFFRFTLTEDIEGRYNPATFVMSRDSNYTSDDPANPWKGLPYSSVQVAAVSALKDAYIQRKRVIAKGSRPRIGPGRDHVELFCVTLSERSGDYMYRVAAGSVVDATGRRVAHTHARAKTVRRRGVTRR